ncbi:MAG: aminodeoxychorismate synthase component I [Deltaproteobacteria bacterium]|nr:aminodeoxychorismate synthase component I [Deltaproteobacteria bacterium]
MKWVRLRTDRSPCELFRTIVDLPYCFFLDSSDDHGFSIWSACPQALYDSLGEMEAELCNRGALEKNLPSEFQEFPFMGGGVGWISYDAVRLWEPKLSGVKKNPKLPQNICFGRYDTFFIHDHRQKATYLISVEERENDVEKFNLFQDRCSSRPVEPKPFVLEVDVESNMTFAQYERMLQQALFYIRQGEIYQVNLSQCFSADFSTHLTQSENAWSIYEQLRKINPAPFSAYIHFNDVHILSVSPERFLKIDRGRIQTQPIKGTVPRAKNPLEDEGLKQTLCNSEKNLAEHRMIVDLERNDLGKICRTGSVRVTKDIELLSLPSVHHLVSTIEGQLCTQRLSDIVCATFPGGSITGAPKLRAMQIIDELEPHARMIYTGSLGYMDYRGQWDLNIAIRTLLAMNGKFYFPMGGGIVSDSHPREEFEETLHKGKTLMAALQYQNGRRFNER